MVKRPQFRGWIVVEILQFFSHGWTRMLFWVESIMLLGIALALALAEQTSEGHATQEIHKCSETRCWGKRIIGHGYRLVEFYRPFGTDFHRVAGFEGDLHDSITIHSKGETSELLIFTANITWGPVQTRPEWFGFPDAPKGSVHRWHCAEDQGRDFRMAENGRSWRFLMFLKGYAEYKNVPSKAAAKFDRILDSLCCRPLPPH